MTESRIQSDNPTRTSALILAVIALYLYFAGRAPYLGQWDSFDYLKQIVTHRLSDLGIGRPFFLGYNIILWEAMKKTFGLHPLWAESIVLAGVILLGVAGVLLFRGLARQIMPAPASRLATVAFLLSPVYALYSGCVMTEIPMLAAILAAALILWQAHADSGDWRYLAGGALFGIAVGTREQAITLVGAFMWILWVRHREFSSRLRAVARFSLTALFVIAAPALVFYLRDPAGFAARTLFWWKTIPTGETQLGKNVEASLLYLFAVCPGSWIALLMAGLYRSAATAKILLQKRQKPTIGMGSILDAGGSNVGKSSRVGLPSSLWGFTACLVIPILALWGDADIQIHPRYALIALPASAVLCASLYHRWVPSTRAAVIWTLLQLAIFCLSQAAIQPFRQLQEEKKAYAQTVCDMIRGDALLIAGAYSPIFDYYRASGERPQWRVLWSGWGWKKDVAASTIADTWARHEPVYLCDGPGAWFNFEEQRLDLHFILLDCRREVISPGLVRVLPK